MSTELLGCCGAYCKPCKVYAQNLCKGCKTGYATGERDIARAKCPMKVCCIRRGLVSCADCDAYATCETLLTFYGHDSYKYKKYKQATEYIRGFCLGSSSISTSIGGTDFGKASKRSSVV